MTIKAESDLFSVYRCHLFVKFIQICVYGFDMFDMMNLKIVARSTASTDVIKKNLWFLDFSLLL